MNYFDLPRRILRLGILCVASLVALQGCRSEQPPAAVPAVNSAPMSLRLLVIGDSGLAKAIQREWDARSEGELKLRELSEDEFLTVDQRRLAADAVIYPSPLLGDLAERGWLAPLPKDRLDDPGYQQRDIFAATRKQEMVWEEETYAVPLGGPPLLLFYRRDVFDRLALQPPQSWVEYRELSERLANREHMQEFLATSEAKWFGTCEPLQELWAAQLLLARAAAYSKHRSQFSTLFDYRTMKPLIAGPPFIRALQELAAATKFGPATPGDLAPADTIKLIHDGQCAMAIGWLADTNDSGVASTPGAPPAIGVIPLPGSRDIYNFRSDRWEQRSTEESPHVPLVGISGRLGSLTRECRQPAAAVHLLLWLSGPEMSAPISAASPSTGPYRQTHVAQIDKWTGPRSSAGTVQQYAEAVQQSLGEPNCLIGLRIPGRQQYLRSLAEAVRATIAGQASAEAALADVAKKWQAITESLGVDTQRLAYTRSIGLQP